MKGLGSRIALAAISAALLGIGGEHFSAGSTLTDQQPAGRIVQVTSGRCVGLNEQTVSQDAREKAWQNLYSELAGLAEECSGFRPGRRHLVAEHAWLLSQRGVEQQVDENAEVKAYGPIAECSIRITLPEPVLAQWAARLKNQQRQGIKAFLYGVAGTLVGWLAALGVLVVLDRLTGGYRRGMLVILISVVVVVMTALGWGLLLIYFDVVPSLVAVLESAVSGG